MNSPGSGMARDADPFEHDDAAYLVGALRGADRDAFEAHLARCEACSARVAALRAVVGVLASGGDAVHRALASSLEQERPDALPDPAAAAMRTTPADGPDRVAEVVRIVERRRRRARWALGGLSAVAAAAVVALVVAVAAPSANPAPAVAAQQMTATGIAAISATAAITPAAWGSEITINCSYIGTPQYASADIYALQVVDQSGHTHEIGSWTLASSTHATFTSGTALAAGQIRAINVITSDGAVVLRLAV